MLKRQLDTLKLHTLETNRLLLRAPRDADLDDLLSIYSNPTVVRHTGDTPWRDEDDASEFLEGAREGLREGSLYGWCVELKDTGRVIGTCALFDCDLEKRVAEISYESHPDYWNQGFTSEFLPQVIEFGFRQLQLNRISAFVDTRNSASVKLLLNNGFEHEGIMRESWVEKSGDPVDEYVMGLLYRDWASRTDAR
ncbi:MAG: GNAT family N-acetyltransferase [Halieaceae bacterium]|nr:GNAT family N-acetyltransferase [Halieaceae bacterium]